MKFERLLNLNTKDLFKDNPDIEKLSGWEFLGTVWSGHALGFTSVLKKKSNKCICINIPEISTAAKKEIYKTTSLDLNTLTKSNIKKFLSAPNIVNPELNTIEYISKGYYASFTFDNKDKLTYIVLSDFIPKVDISTKNDIKTDDQLIKLIENRKKEGGLINYNDFKKLKHEDFFEKSSSESNFSFMKKRWFAKRYNCSDFYYDKKDNSMLQIISVSLEDFNKNKLKAFNIITGLPLEQRMTKDQIENITSNKPVFSQEYGPTMIYDYLIKTSNNESYLLQVTVDNDEKIGLCNVMLTPNIKLQGFKWAPV